MHTATFVVKFSCRCVQFRCVYVKLLTDRQTNAGHYITSFAEVSICSSVQKCTGMNNCDHAVDEQVAQLSQRNRAAAWVSFGWVVDDGVGQ